ncbi:MAG: low molecular weight protein arginine phosphatase, partial [Defluviitaleaceae bacterium]|nr:low molecular weight protein arginine phosphatase [Defluviitaleaceae bacterium]
MAILFICTGNTCRSPMAEGLAKKILAHKFPAFVSRGAFALDGIDASDNAVDVMRDIYDVDISDHLSRIVTDEDVAAASLILTMTNSHKQHMARFYPMAESKLYTLCEYAYGEPPSDGHGDISDPFMQGYEIYANCAAEIEAAL